MVKATVDALYETDSGTVTYIVSCPETKEAVVIDSVLDYDAPSGSTSVTFAKKILEKVKERGLKVKYCLETHAHADHLTAAPYLSSVLEGKPPIGIGKLITQVQDTFSKIYGSEMKCDGSQFDKLFEPGENFAVGKLQFEVLHTPGHTPDHLSYHLPGDSIFVGDSLFMPDSGSARCDFPGGSSHTLWNSVQKILALPDDTKIFVGHDYGANKTREPAWETTVALEKTSNIHVKVGTEEKQFCEWRTTRDGTLAHPRLIVPAIQVNIQAGKFPAKESNGQTFLRIPINVFKPGEGVVNV